MYYLYTALFRQFLPCLETKSLSIQRSQAIELRMSFLTANARFKAALKSKPKGFTMIELLVVLVLMGLLASVAITTVGSGNQQRELRNEVNRLHAVLRMASEEAVFSNVEIGALIDNDLYEFLTYDEEKKQWVEAQQSFLKPYSLPDWVTVDFSREDETKTLLGETESQDVTELESKKPSLMLLSSGEVTDFVIGMQIDSDDRSRIEIRTDEQGEIVLPMNDPDDE